MATAEVDKGNTTINIPSEVIYDILLRLPAKSLLRFRSLSKHYLSVISHPDFIAHHLAFSISRSNKSPLLLLQNGYHSFLPISLLNPNLTITQIFFPFDGIRQSLEVTGSCNGLLLAKGTTISDNRLLLWNPATRHFRHVPLPSPEGHGSRYGLGFNSHMDDYYVMQISNIFDNKNVSHDELLVDDSEIIVQAKLFSCRKNIWTIVCSNLPHAFYYSCPVALKLGGRDHLFWLGFSYEDKIMIILAFDMIKLDFRMVEFPLVDHQDEDAGLDITNFKESLAVIRHSYQYCSKCRIELWVLNNENSSDSCQDSWTRIYNFQRLPSRIRPIIIWGEGELIFHKDDMLCACDTIVDDLDLENTSVRHISHTYLYVGCTYVESLVPVY